MVCKCACVYTFYVHIVAKYIRLHLDAELILPVRRIVLDSAQPVQLLISVTQLVEHLPRKQYVVVYMYMYLQANSMGLINVRIFRRDLLGGLSWKL